MRFHSMILSIINNIPFLAISYGQKTQELLKDFEYEYALNPKKFNFEDFIHTFESLEKSNNEAKFALKAKYDTIRSNIELEYNNFFDGLKQN
jgi:polysaccharide pyruvyl transferase WcaK-like protein